MFKEIIDPDLSGRNSFRVPQRAARLIEFETAEDLRQLFAGGTVGEWFVLGGGNNILFTQDYPSTLLHCTARGIRTVERTDDHATVEADAGTEWDDLVDWSVRHGLWGLENLSLIPGTVGAAPVQNIGAYGCEAKDAIVQVEMFCPETGNVLILDREHCGFGYRDSIFKRSLQGRAIITSVRFRLGTAPAPRLDYGDVASEVARRGEPTLHNIREAICAIRRTKLPDPAQTGNAGSFFKNPVVPRSTAERLLEQHPDMPHYPTADPDRIKLAAGWLIDRTGLKGWSLGRVGIHPRQALVVVNLGGAGGGEILAFAGTIRQRVLERFGVEIEPEVNIL
ncbi:MAG: UDP-N-acetylmuramate dehydrogenase [Alistipes sp.]|nr:UDP-N-acetylmuramate dehydrogenase [Alistipes sp.]